MAKSTVKGTKIKLDRSDIIIRTIGYVVVTFYALACVLPFLIIIGTSFTSEEVIRTEGAQLFPKQFTTKAYEMVLQGGAIWKSYGLTITMTLTGTLVGLVLCRERISHSAMQSHSTSILPHCSQQVWLRTTC
mgnify:CR=1 FL=1